MFSTNPCSHTEKSLIYRQSC